MIGKIEDLIFSFEASNLVYAVCSSRLGSGESLFALPLPYLKRKDPGAGLFWDPCHSEHLPAYSLSGLPPFYRGKLIYDHDTFQAWLNSLGVSHEAP